MTPPSTGGTRPSLRPTVMRDPEPSATSGAGYGARTIRCRRGTRSFRSTAVPDGTAETAAAPLRHRVPATVIRAASEIKRGRNMSETTRVRISDAQRRQFREGGYFVLERCIPEAHLEI